MPTERPPTSKPGARRAPATPTKIPTGLPIGKILPYVLAAGAAAALIYLLRTPRFATFGAFGIGIVVFIVLGWVAVSSRQHLAPDDRLRHTLPLVAIASITAAAIPFAMTIYPPSPQGTITLAHAGDAGGVAVRGPGVNVWLAVSGRFDTTAAGDANYFLTVSHDGGATEHVDGRLRPHPGGPLPERHLLGAHGSGTYTVRLEQSSASVALPLRVDVRTRPFSTFFLVLIYIGMAAMILSVDTMLWRRGHEPAFAAALLLPLVAVIYFQRNVGSDNLPTDLVAAGIIGALGGGLGGEVLARAVRMVVGK